MQESKHYAKQKKRSEHTALSVILSFFHMTLCYIYVESVAQAVSRGTWPCGPLSAVKAKEKDLMQASVTG